MNKTLINLLVLTVLLGCSTKGTNTNVTFPEVRRVNSKEFLIKHGLKTLRKKIILVDNKSYPKEIFGYYTVYKTLEKNNSVKEYTDNELFIGLVKEGILIRGFDELNLISNIKIEYLKYSTLLRCVNKYEFSPSVFIFDEDVMVLAMEGGILAFLKKIELKDEK
jgi:hypothetical protein